MNELLHEITERADSLHSDRFDTSEECLAFEVAILQQAIKVMSEDRSYCKLAAYNIGLRKVLSGAAAIKLASRDK